MANSENNWTWIDGCDDLSNLEVSQIDRNIVMSLLDDMQGDQLGYDDERLISVIKSLEAEINHDQSCYTFNIVSELALNNNSFEDKQGRNYDIEDLQSRDPYQSQDFTESNDLDFGWMEMDMEMEMNFWNNYGQDYPCTISFEENDYHSLWQEQNV
ncbi:unnamed protein product [Withania somnifera]